MRREKLRARFILAEFVGYIRRTRSASLKHSRLEPLEELKSRIFFCSLLKQRMRDAVEQISNLKHPFVPCNSEYCGFTSRLSMFGSVVDDCFYYNEQTKNFVSCESTNQMSCSDSG